MRRDIVGLRTFSLRSLFFATSPCDQRSLPLLFTDLFSLLSRSTSPTRDHNILSRDYSTTQSMSGRNLKSFWLLEWERWWMVGMVKLSVWCVSKDTPRRGVSCGSESRSAGQSLCGPWRSQATGFIFCHLDPICALSLSLSLSLSLCSWSLIPPLCLRSHWRGPGSPSRGWRDCI